MAGSVTISYFAALDAVRRPVRRAEFAWVSDASGDVSGTPSEALSGQIVRVVFTPDSGGTQPTNLYDVTMLDAGGVDVLAGQGANLSNAAASAVCPGVPLKDGTTTSVIPAQVDGVLNLVVANAGNAKGGTVTVYLR